MRIFDKMSARLSFQPKYCRADAEKAMKHLLFMYHEAMSIFLGSKDVLNLAYFWVFQNYTVSDPPSCTNRSPPWGIQVYKKLNSQIVKKMNKFQYWENIT